MHNRKSEVAKDFKGTIAKLLKYDKSIVKLLFVCLILSFASSALAIIGPDKLKDITNVVANNIMTGIPLNEVKDIAEDNILDNEDTKYETSDYSITNKKNVSISVKDAKRIVRMRNICLW